MSKSIDTKPKSRDMDSKTLAAAERRKAHLKLQQDRSRQRSAAYEKRRQAQKEKLLEFNKEKKQRQVVLDQRVAQARSRASPVKFAHSARPHYIKKNKHANKSDLHFEPNELKKLMRHNDDDDIYIKLPHLPLDTLIRDAALNKLDNVMMLINNHADVNHTDSDGLNALMWATGSNNTELIAYLIKSKTNLETRDNYGNTALFHCISTGHLKSVKLLINSKASLLTTDFMDHTAVDIAVKSVQIHLLDYLSDKQRKAFYNGVKDGWQNSIDLYNTENPEDKIVDVQDNIVDKIIDFVSPSFEK